MSAPALLRHRDDCPACVRFATLIADGSGGRVRRMPVAPLAEPELELPLRRGSVVLRGSLAVAGLVWWIGPARAVRIAARVRAEGVLRLPRGRSREVGAA